jgi:hypothetical protein
LRESLYPPSAPPVLVLVVSLVSLGQLGLALVDLAVMQASLRPLGAVKYFGPELFAQSYFLQGLPSLSQLLVSLAWMLDVERAMLAEFGHVRVELERNESPPTDWRPFPNDLGLLHHIPRHHMQFPSLRHR